MQTAWYNDTVFSTNLAPGAQATANLTDQAVIPAGFGGAYSILRTILELTMNVVTLASAANAVFGLFVGPDQLLSTPPDPEDDLIDWYLLKPVSWSSNTGEQTWRFNVDLRTARRIRGEGRTLMLTVKAALANSSNIEFTADFRFLLGR